MSDSARQRAERAISHVQDALTSLNRMSATMKSSDTANRAYMELGYLRSEFEELDAERDALADRVEAADRQKWADLERKTSLHEDLKDAQARAVAAEERAAELEKALEPFAVFGGHNTQAESGHGWYWQSRIHYESISTWFGPSDFGLAAALVSSASPDTEATKRERSSISYIEHQARQDQTLEGGVKQMTDYTGLDQQPEKIPDKDTDSLGHSL